MKLSVAITGVALTLGCSPKADDTNMPNTIESYEFTSAITGEPSVSRSGQVFRQLLIDDMKGYLGDLTARIDSGEYFPAAGDVTADLNFYFEFDGDTSGSLEHGLAVDMDTLQATYGDLSSGKDLVSKLAGNDATGQHQDWSMGIVGWDSNGAVSPETLVRNWFAQIDEMAVDRANGIETIGPDGAPLSAVYLTPDGTDLRQLIEKFLRGAVAYSQGTDDYLDDDIDGKGLNAEHTVVDEGKNYTALEHAWDEAFGYFGAATDYAQWTDTEIKEETAMDVDGDGYIDLINETNWGHSINAAKRDLGSSDSAPADFTQQAWDGFTMGRALLAETAGAALTGEEMEQLQAYRDEAVAAWEMSISSTVVHYINDVIRDLEAGASVDDVAKHFSELKGFSLSLQFNPRSMVSDADFAEFQGLIGQSPYEYETEEYVSNLLSARDIIVSSYGFAAENEGDESGDGGW